MMNMTKEEKATFDWGMRVSSQYKKNEAELIDVLIETERTKVFKKLNCPSLFRYAVDVLGLSESISVARKIREVPALKSAGLSVAKASRIVVVLNSENAGELIEFARNHTAREIDFEVARRNPKAASRDRIKPLSEDFVELTISVSKEFLKSLSVRNRSRRERADGRKDLVPRLRPLWTNIYFMKIPFK